jgi:xylulokinase
VTLKVAEGAAYGAALQALWCWRREQGEKVTIQDLADEFIEINREETAHPEAKNVAVYEEWQALQDEMSVSLRDVFVKHRWFVTGGENG